MAINYAEDGYDDDDFDEGDGPRRPTGLRSLRREESTAEKLPVYDKLGKEVHAPVEVQGVFRDWMIKRMLRPAYVHPHPHSLQGEVMCLLLVLTVR